MYCMLLPSTSPDAVPPTRLSDGQLTSLYVALQAIPDPRSAHGRRYDLPFLLTRLVAALLCNCNSTCAVGQWCCEQQRLLRRVFGPPHTPRDQNSHAVMHLKVSVAFFTWSLGKPGTIADSRRTQ
jgi:hypothetical protein